MLITNKEELKQYDSGHRVWQGIPGIEVTKGGRIFSTFYSGSTRENIGNYVMLVKSDNGVDFSEPIAVIYKKDHRCFDPCLWIDPLGRLWLTWSMMPAHGTYAIICDDPDADEITFGDIQFIGHDVMMNKPTVLSTGEWLFPIAVWNDGVRVLSPSYDSPEADKRSFVYKTVDNGKTFEKLGGADVEFRSYDEHMVLEMQDGRLAMFVRTDYGIGVSYSYDRGLSWTEGRDSGLGGPSSRFFIKRLESGRILLVNHDNSKARNNLTAYLSEDDGLTWKYKLLLDRRDRVSYPDAAVDENGYIYVTYDRERGDLRKSLDEAYEQAREILYAKITENDIIAGKLVSPGSKLKCIVSKLGKYYDEQVNPYKEVQRFSDLELASFLLKEYPEQIVDKIFEYYSVNCVNMYRMDAQKLDALIERLDKEPTNRIQIITEIITLVRSVLEFKTEEFPVIEAVKKIILEQRDRELSMGEIAEKVGISRHYLMHLFKKITGTTVMEYKKAIRLVNAKKMLIDSNKPITEIALECGFSTPSYFAEVFMQNEHVSPTEYRNLLQRKETEK